MNVFNAIGRVGKDAEQRTTQGGSIVVSFSLAVDSGYGQNKQTNWVECSIWGKQAESSLYTYIRKGEQLGITGEISLENWINKDGEERKTLRCRINDVTLLGNKNEQDAAADNTANTGASQAASGGGSFDDDIPFAQFERGQLA